MRSRHPVEGALNLSAVRRVAALRLRVPCTAQRRDLTRLVLNQTCACEETSVTEAHLLADREAKPLLVWRDLNKVFTLNVELSGERDLS